MILGYDIKLFYRSHLVSPENRFSGEVIDKKWIIIDLMIGFGEISNTPHLSLLPYSPTPTLIDPKWVL